MEWGEMESDDRHTRVDGKLKPYVLSSAEQDGHDQRMGKSDLEAVHQAVPCALENGEVVMVSRVVQDGP